jgi:hypothetical protein
LVFALCGHRNYKNISVYKLKSGTRRKEYESACRS